MALNNPETPLAAPFVKKGTVKQVHGSVIATHNAGLRFVLNIVNMVGKTDAPIYDVFDKKWRKVKEDAKGWFHTRDGFFKLGAIRSVATQSDTWVIQMLCQDDKLALNTKSLDDCLKKVCDLAKYEKASVHVSQFVLDAVPGLPALLDKHCVDKGVSVYYYDEK